jgi:hypothetical protein
MTMLIRMRPLLMLRVNTVYFLLCLELLDSVTIFTKAVNELAEKWTKVCKVRVSLLYDIVRDVQVGTRFIVSLRC